MDALMHSVATTGYAARDSLLSIQNPQSADSGGAVEVASLLDRDNLDFVAIHLYGLTDPLSNEPMGKWGYIGD
jgi:hypothetical protein